MTGIKQLNSRVIELIEIDMNVVHENREIMPQLVELPELADRALHGQTLLDGNLSLIRGVKVKLSVLIGGTTVTVGELLAMKEGAVLKLDRLANQPIDVLLDGRIVAKGCLVAVDDNFGVSITEIAR